MSPRLFGAGGQLRVHSTGSRCTAIVRRAVASAAAAQGQQPRCTARALLLSRRRRATNAAVIAVGAGAAAAAWSTCCPPAAAAAAERAPPTLFTLHVNGIQGALENEARLEELFAQFGTVESVTLRRRRPDTHHMDGSKDGKLSWALITFSTQAGLVLAIADPVLQEMGLTVRRMDAALASKSGGAMPTVTQQHKHACHYQSLDTGKAVFKEATLQERLHFALEDFISTSSYPRMIILGASTGVLFGMSTLSFWRFGGVDMAPREAMWHAWTTIADPGTHTLTPAGKGKMRTVGVVYTLGGLCIFALLIGLVNDGISAYPPLFDDAYDIVSLWCVVLRGVGLTIRPAAGYWLRD
jgi:hypothetical protein